MARISVDEWCKQNGVEGEEEFMEVLEEAVCDSVCPALCDEGCEVEPDGTCEHGAPSLLLAMHLI